MGAKVEINSWKNDFNGAIKIIAEKNLYVLEKAVEIFKERVIKRTPVGDPRLWNYPAPAGYVPGTLQKSWELNKITASLYELVNPQPYALRVEKGWSTQAPTGMLRVTALEWSSIVKEAKGK